MKDQAGFATDYANLNAKKTGENYSDSSIYMIEIPNGISTITDGYFGKNGGGGRTIDHVEKIVILSQNVVTIGGSHSQPFRDMPTCKSITFPKSFKTLINEQWTFNNCSALIEVIFEKGSQAEIISFARCTKLERINIEDLTNLKRLGDGCFSGCTSLQFTNFDLTHTKLETIGSSAFLGCTWLQALALPDTVTTFGYECFGSCTNMYFASDYLPESLTSIKGRFLKYCKNINNTLIFPEGFTAFETGDGIFEGMTVKADSNNKRYFNLVFLGDMTSVQLTGGSISSWANTTTLYFAKNEATDVNGRIVQGYTDTNGQKYYLCCDSEKNAIYTEKTGGSLTLNMSNNNPNNETSYTPSTGSDGNRYNKIGDGSPSFVFCGGESVEQIFWARNGSTSMGYQIFYTTPYEYDMNAHTTEDEHFCSRKQVQKQNCGYDGIFNVQCIVCDKLDQTITPATGNHIYTADNDCTTAETCTTCLLVVVDSKTHDIKTVIEYLTGYLNNGNVSECCANDGCTIMNCEYTCPPIFVNNGYSYSDSAVLQGFVVNNDALEAYEKTGKAVKYGLVVASVAKLGETNTLFDGTTLKTGAFSVSFDDKRQYSIFEMQVTGLTTTEYKALDLFVCAYVIENDTVTYISNGAESTTVDPVSHNDLTGVSPSDNTDVIIPKEEENA
ncbi:MAG: leucine-rich repeat domain-containing protein [Clostridia bacterium]|nr:leucine-rich repeat domain-containing protein [Clostridia bacterium]